jgi:hypothetical protein
LHRIPFARTATTPAIQLHLLTEGGWGRACATGTRLRRSAHKFHVDLNALLAG